jgi:hypothetical protein
VTPEAPAQPDARLHLSVKEKERAHGIAAQETREGGTHLWWVRPLGCGEWKGGEKGCCFFCVFCLFCVVSFFALQMLKVLFSSKTNMVIFLRVNNTLSP